MKKIALCLLLLAGCSSPRKPCQVERIGNEHNKELREMLDQYPCTTMDLLQTITRLEEETGHYQ